jgi:Carboxypeptidase regulatory-like domain
MKRRASWMPILAKPAGLWLRCFLGATIWAVLFLGGEPSVSAQIDIPKPERLTHVEGIVVNSAGHPVADIEVTLTRDERVMYRTRTDGEGGFEFEHVSGQYLLRVKRSEYAPAAREIAVTDEIVTLLQRKKLYVILGPGACMDACSSVLTSKKDFDQAIRKKNRH